MKARSQSGFTFIEMIIVLSVIGLLTSIAAPMFSPGRWRADSAALEMAAALTSAQRLAVLRQHDVILTFLETDRAVRVHRDDDNDGNVDSGEDVRLVELPETIGFGMGSAPSIAGDLTSATVTFSDPGTGRRLVFHRNGSASEAGRIYLRPLQGSLSADATGARVLTVERSTGEIVCRSYISGAWEARC